MQQMEECPVNKKRATWETILDGKVCVFMVSAPSTFACQAGSVDVVLHYFTRLNKTNLLVLF